MYNLDVKGLTVPIALNCNTSGIRVKDIPGQVGTGWSLAAGGVITRVVMSLPDDHETGGDIDEGNKQTYRRIYNSRDSGWQSTLGEDNLYRIIFNTPGASTDYIPQSTQYQQYTAKMDAEIDYYYFNFMGISGRFTFTNDGKPMLMTGTEGLRIEYNNKRYKITDAKGIQYFFDEVETALDPAKDAPWGVGSRYVTSWYLTKIYMPQQQQTVNFSYTRYSNYDLTPPNDPAVSGKPFGSRVDRLRYAFNIEYEGPVHLADVGDFFFRSYSDNSLNDLSDALFIREIKWGDTRVTFHGAMNREDRYKYKLDSIDVLHDETLLHKVKLDYGYFIWKNTPDGKKLKLNQVTINDQVYKLGYYESLWGKTVPGITAAGQDIWGYYNGEDDEEDIMPYYKVMGALAQIHSYVSYFTGGACSTPKNYDHRFAQLGTLSSITYPTGGKSVFEYEGNDYSRVGFLQEGQTVETDIFTQMKLDSVRQKTATISNDPLYTNIFTVKERDFVIHKTQMTNLTTGLGLTFGTTYDQYLNYVQNQGAHISAYVQRYNDSSQSFENIREFHVNPSDIMGPIYSAGTFDAVKVFGFVETSEAMMLTQGRYKLVVIGDGWYMGGGIGVEQIFPYKKDALTYYGPGIRIKKIAFSGNDGQANQLVKQYTYFADGRSTGVLESPFGNLSKSLFVSGFRTSPLNTTYKYASYYVNFNSEPLIPLGNTQGGAIDYQSVTEVLQDSSRIVYHYTAGGIANNSYGDVFVENTEGVPTRIRVLLDNAAWRGLLVRTDYYDSAKVMVKQLFTDYQSANDPNKRSVSMGIADANFFLASGREEYFIQGLISFSEYYYFRAHQYNLKLRDSAILYSGGDRKIIDVTKYKYNDNGLLHTYPVSSAHIGSVGQTITQMRYALDYKSLGANPVNHVAKSIKKLIDNNIISTPLEIWVQKAELNGSNPRTTAAQYVQYGELVSLPDTVFTLRNSQTILGFQELKVDSISSNKHSLYQPDLIFYKYDAYGNVVEQGRDKNMKDVFLWGYDHRYPVVRVVGSDYNTVVNLVDTAILNNPQSESQLNQEIQKIRNAFTNSFVQVTSYMYAPAVGISAEIDVAGRKISYLYDAQGRLSVIKDQDGNILKKICYNYAGQSTPCN